MSPPKLDVSSSKQARTRVRMAALIGVDREDQEATTSARSAACEAICGRGSF